jgi:uroporphyrinogen-III synthase
MLIFTSPSAVHAYKNLNLPREGASIAVLGPVTEKAACDTFGQVNVKAPVYTLDALAGAILDFYTLGQGNRDS